MHFNLKKAVVLTAVPLLGGALGVGAAALPASAQTFQDTALQAFNVTAAPSPTGAVVKGTVSAGGSRLSFTAPSGEEFASSPAPKFTQGIPATDATLTTANVHRLVLTTGGFTTGSGTLTFTITSTTSGVTCTAAETVKVTETSGVLAESATPTSVPGETVTVSAFNNNTTGAVEFTGTVTVQSCTVTFSESNLPAGLVSGNPLVPGSAVPRTDGNFYGGVVYTATDPLGSTFTGTFDLHVFGHRVAPPPPPGNFGDEVNSFGNGFDAFQQHQFPGAIIAGWTATQGDPATHFIRNAGTHQGAFQFEYAPHGTAVGLCVSDPGGGWSSDPLRDGLILTPCNTGPWQQFIPQSNGTLKNAATGLFVNPNGTGAQLRGATAPTPWGGSVYHWKDFASLPR
ncbi:MAG: hypothetical protein ACRDOB_15750 [Streptosporangiaceae bacterium]